MLPCPAPFHPLLPSIHICVHIISVAFIQRDALKVRGGVFIYRPLYFLIFLGGIFSCVGTFLVVSGCVAPN